MKILTVIRNVVCVGALTLVGNSAFAACVSGGAGCTTITGKVSATVMDVFSIYKGTTGVAAAFPSTAVAPYMIAFLDTSNGGSISPTATTCNYSGGASTSYKVGMLYGTNATTANIGPQAILSSLLTAKTAGNTVVVTIDGATCLVVAAQVQP